MLRPPTLASSTDRLRLFYLAPSPRPLPSNPLFRPLPRRNPSFAPRLHLNVRLRSPRPSASSPSTSSSSAKRLEDSEGAVGEAVAEEERSVGEEEAAAGSAVNGAEESGLSVGIGNPRVPGGLGIFRMSVSDQAFFLLAFIAVTTSLAFTSLVVAAIPTLFAMKRAAKSLAKLADIAREELPSTMAAIRLSGMEISDLTLELSDLSQEIADGVSKSAQAVQAAEAGIRQMGAMAREQTISMIQERANLPSISIKPVVAGAARTTSRVVGQARKTFMNLLSRGEEGSVSDAVES
ncbi:uncharacterized protein LOC109722984 [Ananas comosus]|uniref:Uncharacterized protein LOC109722984 n=1 Tax=Ananas comosus TaxID=4615 RepID=A0A6P5GN18_ANACO|nr:uncharacterized protein LOC109722984 [Ananas comosus]